MSRKLLINEDLENFRKRHQQILEYNFYIPNAEEDLNEDDEIEGEENGGFPEPAGDDPAMDAEVPDMGGEEATAPEAEPGMEEPEGPMEPEMDGEELPEPEGEINAPDAPEPEAEAGGDEVELDVTDIVQKSDEAKMASDEANMKIDQVMAKLGELESKLPNMDVFGQKLEDLEKEIARRNPTETEKLEMRSMDSFPYNLKLTDYWNQEDDSDYEVTNGEGQEFEKEEELVLTQADVDATYSDNNVKNTFDYEEEDI